MWYLHSTETWIEEVVKSINEKQLNPANSKFMIAFFSSLDTEFVEYFQTLRVQISSVSGENFHIFTPLIFENKIIEDDEWRKIKDEFRSFGIPIQYDPTLVFFTLKQIEDGSFEPSFFAAFECNSFLDFPKKMRNAIDETVSNTEIQLLQERLQEIFRSKNLLKTDRVSHQLKQTFTERLPIHKIFVSHSSQDKEFARNLIHELSGDSSLKFWIDEKEIKVGDDIQNEITNNLRESDYLLLIISENSVNSKWVNFEVSQFMNFPNRNIIPLIISKNQNFTEPIDNLIKRLKYLDFSDKMNWHQNISELKAYFQSNRVL